MLSEHERLIDGLEISTGDWASEALLSCLRRLRDGGPTQSRDVTVLDAWPITDGFCMVYEMYEFRLGVRVTRTTGEGPPFFFNRGVHGPDPSPRAFGVEIADYAIAEPLGSLDETLVTDEAGVTWWGDPPLPGSRV
ncbi:MAG: hypothetical protein ACRYG2_03235 [Janthinobacterium lividum]